MTRLYRDSPVNDEGTGRTDEALSVGLDRRSGRGLHHTLGRIFGFTRFTEGTHTRRDIRAGSTFRAALSLDRFIVGVRAIGRPEESNSCARAVLHQAPFKTSNAGHLGPGCVCACPYQGASRGCWPTDGATIFIPGTPPTTARHLRRPIPKSLVAGRAFGLNLPPNRAEISLRRCVCQDAAKDYTDPFGSIAPLIVGVRHERQRRSEHGRRVEKIGQKQETTYGCSG